MNTEAWIEVKRPTVRLMRPTKIKRLGFEKFSKMPYAPNDSVGYLKDTVRGGFPFLGSLLIWVFFVVIGQ